jgi:DNA-binding Xre family transcriptional regulator
MRNISEEDRERFVNLSRKHFEEVKEFLIKLCEKNNISLYDETRDIAQLILAKALSDASATLSFLNKDKTDKINQETLNMFCELLKEGHK